MFSKDGLMNTIFQLQSQDQEWLLLSKSLNMSVSKATRNGWQVSSYCFHLFLEGVGCWGVYTPLCNLIIHGVITDIISNSRLKLITLANFIIQIWLVVKLIGYCLEGENRLLVYQFMPKGSLENHLFKSKYVLLMFILNYWILMLIHNNET